MPRPRPELPRGDDRQQDSGLEDPADPAAQCLHSERVEGLVHVVEPHGDDSTGEAGDGGVAEDGGPDGAGAQPQPAEQSAAERAVDDVGGQPEQRVAVAEEGDGQT